MADNTRGGSQDAADPLIATDEVTHSGDTADVQLIRPVHVTGSEGSKTVVDITDANGVKLAGGTQNIGDVDVLTLPADPLGANADAIVAAGAVGSVSAKLRRLTQGVEDLKTTIVLAAGSANIGDVDVLTLPGVGGLAAHASATSGNPVYVAGRASAVIPTDVGADGDAAGMWTNRNGATVVLMAPHVGLNSDPWNLVHEGAQYTSAQTSTALVAGGASEKIVVTKVQIQAYGTTAGTAILYFGTGAYSRGTNRAIFDGEFAPSATNKPGVVMDGPFIAGANGDDLLVTTTNALSITFSVWYYVVT